MRPSSDITSYSQENQYSNEQSSVCGNLLSSLGVSLVLRASVVSAGELLLHPFFKIGGGVEVGWGV